MKGISEPKEERGYRARRLLAAILAPLYLGLIFGTPLATAAVALQGIWPLSQLLAILCFAISPLLAVLIAGTLSRFHRRHVVEGRFPVDVGIKSYFHRRLYGLCWTAVYYSGPLYYLVLSSPLLKRITFRLFGYRGSMAFTIYPDTWIRDLPLLDFGTGCYLSNKATIGTNMIFFRGDRKWIEVGPIWVGRNSLVGHLTVIGPGSVIGDDVQVGVVSAIGRRSRVGNGCLVSDTVVIDHGVRLDDGAVVPTRAYVASGVRVGKDIVMKKGEVLLRRRVASEGSVDQAIPRDDILTRESAFSVSKSVQ